MSTSTRIFSINVIEIKDSKKIFKVKKKPTRVLLDETFEDILLNFDVDTTFKQSQIKVRKYDSDNAFHCEIDKKISDILEFDPNFKVMEAFLTYKSEESTVEEISRKRDGFNVLRSNARGLEKPKKKKESNGDSVNIFRTFLKLVILNFLTCHFEY